MDPLARLGRNLALGLSAAAALSAFGAWFVAQRFVARKPSPEMFITPWELDIPYEDVSFRTSDGLLLRGWWLPHPGASRTIVTLTGYFGTRSDTIGIGSALWRRGANVLLFDYRGRGTSDPHISTLGYYETLDALAAVDYAARRAPDVPLGVVGYSMGASVAILAAARDTRIAAVVADSPFASQRRVLRRHFLRRTWLPTVPFFPLVLRFLPYDVGEVEPIREIGTITPRAVLLIHGTADTVTDPRDSDTLYGRAGRPRELWLLPGVAHCGAYFADRDAYVERVQGFLERRLATPSLLATA